MAPVDFSVLYYAWTLFHPMVWSILAFCGFLLCCFFGFLVHQRSIYDMQDWGKKESYRGCYSLSYHPPDSLDTFEWLFLLWRLFHLLQICQKFSYKRSLYRTKIINEHQEAAITITQKTRKVTRKVTRKITWKITVIRNLVIIEWTWRSNNEIQRVVKKKSLK